MSRRKSGQKKPRTPRQKEAAPAELALRADNLAPPRTPPRRSQAGGEPPEPPVIKPELPLPPEPPHSEYKPSVALVVAVILTAVLEVLDITIVSVAIPHMLGTFGATSDQITWVLTSYLVSAAVVMPLTGYLSSRLGRRRLLVFSIVGFVISSALCGLAWNLESMVIFRLLQGVCGAPLVPLSQAILLDAFPKEKHGQALAIFGLGIMVAPVLGPTFGGWLTDTFSWRAVFYINVPIGVFALLLAMGHLPKSDIKFLKTDWTGLMLLVLAVGSLQMVLDQGQTPDWFNSRFIQIFTGITVFSSIAFFMRGWNNQKNIIDLSLLKDRNFLAGLLAITAYGVTLFGTIALLPLLTQRLMGYPAMSAGMLFIPRAVASAIALSITGNYLMAYVDPRILVAIGIVLSVAPDLWAANFTSDPRVLESARQYFHMAGPAFGFLGLALSLYFASQGSGKILGPVLAQSGRLVTVILGGWLLLALDAPGWTLFLLAAVSMVIYGVLAVLSVRFTTWGPSRAAVKAA